MLKSGTVKTIIPSRLGSTRIPMKGMRLIGDKTLLEYTIEMVKASRHLSDNIYINSDSEIWGRLAADNQVQFYLRNQELATSNSMIDDYLYDFMIHEPSDYLAVITPTSPLLDSMELDAAWEQYQNSSADTLISAEAFQTHCFYQGKDLNFSRIGKLPRSQDLEPVIGLNFSIAIYDCKAFINNYENLGWAVFTGELMFYLLEGFGTIDIDEEKDFMMAELAMKFKEEQHLYRVRYADYVKELVENRIVTHT